MNAILVDPLVSRQKLAHEVELWKAEQGRQERGWVMLSYDQEKLAVEIAFLGKVATSTGSGFLPIVACAVRLTYENYDLWPPSLTFIDPFTKTPAKPHVGAIMQTSEGFRNVLIESHPDTGLPFLCLPGIREYHTHPQHTGDDWLLHRPTHEGRLSNICERVWRLMANNIMGFQVVINSLPVWPMQAQLVIQLFQGEMQEQRSPPEPVDPSGGSQETKVA